MDASSLIPVGVGIIILGFLVVFTGVLLSGSRDSDSTVSGTGIIMVGPIPIIWGSDRRMVAALILLSLLLVAGYPLIFSR